MVRFEAVGVISVPLDTVDTQIYALDSPEIYGGLSTTCEVSKILP